MQRQNKEASVYKVEITALELLYSQGKSYYVRKRPCLDLHQKIKLKKLL